MNDRITKSLKKIKIKIIVVILRAAEFSSPPERGKKTTRGSPKPGGFGGISANRPGRGRAASPTRETRVTHPEGTWAAAGARRIARLALPEAGERLTWQPCPPPPAATGTGGESCPPVAAGRTAPPAALPLPAARAPPAEPRGTALAPAGPR